MEPTLKIVQRAPPSRKRTRIKVRRKAQPLDPRTKAILIGGVVGLLIVVGLAVEGLRDARAPMLGLLVAATAPVWMTVRDVGRYAPRVRPVRRRELLNVPLGIPIGLLALLVWKLFPPAYLAVDEYMWRAEPSETAYLGGLQYTIDTVARSLVSLLSFSVLLLGQAALWVVPTYWMARWVTAPVEREVETYYRKELRRRAHDLVERSGGLTRFKPGGELADTKIQLRTYGTVLGLFSGLVAMTLFVWVVPLL